jgi:hypothetical protein
VGGSQFEPYHLHHPVVGLKLPQAFSHLLRGNGGFLHSCASLDWSLLGDSRLLRARLRIANFRSRLGGGDRFDNWVVGRQFVPDCLHHPVSGFKPQQG